jgi:hypothetical protein
MNGDDLLARATQALRDTTAPAREVEAEAEAVAATTLARLERSMVGGRTRPVSRWVVFPLAASFVIFAAWASASGNLSRWMALQAHDDVERSAVAPAPSAVAPPAIGTSVVQEPSPPAASSVPEPPSPPAPKRPAPAPSVDVDALYRDAHDAHFVRRDPAASLVAWDRYLAAAGPSGRFALEARYNRAITLVRLGRRAEAAAALKPFADGDYGGYRREEATELLRTLP